MTGWTIRAAGTADLEAVGPLWVEVHHQHAAVNPELGPYVDDAETWRVRRELYQELLVKPDTLLLLAERGGTAIGYGLAHVMAVDDTWIPDTWVTGRQIGEIETLSVSAEYRGAGLGSQMLDRLEHHLRSLGVDDLIVGALPGNHDAIRLYERRGYRPTWLYLSNLSGRRTTE